MIQAINTSTGSEIRSRYLGELEEYASQTGSTIVINHFGEFTQDLINGLSESMEELMISNGDSKKTIKRVFSILIEGLQNIRAHGERDEEGNQYAYLIIMKSPSLYRVAFGNIIQEKESTGLSKYIDKINQMEMKDLKNLYLEILNNSFFTRKGGAGLGFLTMRLKSEQALKSKIQRLNEQKCFFTVEVSIDRNL
jgi:hypothetical protein